MSFDSQMAGAAGVQCETCNEPLRSDEFVRGYAQGEVEDFLAGRFGHALYHWRCLSVTARVPPVPTGADIDERIADLSPPSGVPWRDSLEAIALRARVARLEGALKRLRQSTPQLASGACWYCGGPFDIEEKRFIHGGDVGNCAIEDADAALTPDGSGAQGGP